MLDAFFVLEVGGNGYGETTEEIVTRFEELLSQNKTLTLTLEDISTGGWFRCYADIVGEDLHTLDDHLYYTLKAYDVEACAYMSYLKALQANGETAYLNFNTANVSKDAHSDLTWNFTVSFELVNTDNKVADD